MTQKLHTGMNFTHDFDVAFTVTTGKDADSVTGQELREALIKRLYNLSDEELVEACSCFNTIEE